MKFITALVLAVSLVTSCAHTKNVAKDCGAETAIGLIDDVNTAIATGDYKGEMARLVVKFGLCAVRKAAEIVLDKIGVRARYDSLEHEKRLRLEEWLSDNPE